MKSKLIPAAVVVAVLAFGFWFIGPAESPRGRYKSTSNSTSYSFGKDSVEFQTSAELRTFAWQMQSLADLKDDLEGDRQKRIKHLRGMAEVYNVHQEDLTLDIYRERPKAGAAVTRAMDKFLPRMEELEALEKLDWKGYAARYASKEPEKLVAIMHPPDWRQSNKVEPEFFIYDNGTLTSIRTAETYLLESKSGSKESPR